EDRSTRTANTPSPGRRGTPSRSAHGPCGCLPGKSPLALCHLWPENHRLFWLGRGRQGRVKYSLNSAALYEHSEPEQQPEERLRDVDRIAPLVPVAMALSPFYFRCRFLGVARRHSSCEFAAATRPCCCESIGYGARGDALARAKRRPSPGDQCASQRSGPTPARVFEIRKAGAGALLQPLLRLQAQQGGIWESK